MSQPSWLDHDIEQLLLEQNFQLNITALRQDRTECTTIDTLLSVICERIQDQGHPNEFEIRYARMRIATDVQRILLRWCQEGLKQTTRIAMEQLGFQQPEYGLSAMGIGMEQPTSSCSPSFSPVYGDSPERTRPRLSILPQKRFHHDPVPDDEQRKSPRTVCSPPANVERDLRCPYHVMDPTMHRAECENKNYPNPRKLKEHIWKTTKPFKCENCGEGFGREKTKAIHCNERKVKCKKADSGYHNSPEQRRDQEIERAKNTPEIIEIFRRYTQSGSSAALTDNMRYRVREPSTDSEESEYKAHIRVVVAPSDARPNTPLNEYKWVTNPGLLEAHPSMFHHSTPPYPLSPTASEHSMILDGQGSSEILESPVTGLQNAYSSFDTGESPVSFTTDQSLPCQGTYYDTSFAASPIDAQSTQQLSFQNPLPEITVTGPPSCFPELPPGDYQPSNGGVTAGEQQNQRRGNEYVWRGFRV